MRTITRLLTTAGLVFASIAWATTVHRLTWGDKTTWPTVVSSALDNDEARAELANYIGNALADTTGSNRDEKVAAINLALADRSQRETLVDNLTRLQNDLTTQLSAFDILTKAAAPLPQTATSDVASGNVTSDRAPTALHLKLEQIRIASTWAAAALLTFATLGKTRRTVIRRFGKWALCNGGTWIVVPYAIIAAAHHWTPSFDATIDIAVSTYTARILTAAGALTCVGAVISIVERTTRSRMHRHNSAPATAQNAALDEQRNTHQQRRAAREHATAAHLDRTRKDRETRTASTTADTPDDRRHDDIWAVTHPCENLPTSTNRSDNLDVWAAYDDRRTPPAP